MSSDGISFGEVEHAEPELAIRPDRNAQFATVEVGECRPGELEIFVDLDVMRDMEAHALSNTRVELGGVMLGKQLLDKDGIPYVLITDSLRAEHYEATKGSFKFTHDTWSQITRQRESFHPDLEMVGWYHTHPGWSVFLSGMDLFICNNFFNRPLDVALVIDPCEQDRGWFQWTGSDPPHTQRTGGFKLMTGRLRKDELDYFARIYNKEPDMNYDPRYSSTPTGSTSVQLMDGRKSTMELAVIGLLAMQFMFLLIFGYKMLAPVSSSERVAELEAQVEELQSEKSHSELEEIYKNEFNRLALQKTGSTDYGRELVALRQEQNDIKSNLEGQRAKTRELTVIRNQLASNLKKVSGDLKNVEGKYKKTKAKFSDLEDDYDALKKEKGGAAAGQQLWWLVGGASAFSLGIGLLVGMFVLKRAESLTDEDFADFDVPAKPRNGESPSMADIPGNLANTNEPNQPIDMNTPKEQGDAVKFED